MMLITGGAGFIGSHFARRAAFAGERMVILDRLTYAGKRSHLLSIEGSEGFSFVKGDIRDRALVRQILDSHAPRAIVHFAAESHVDRSIEKPHAFVDANVFGTFALLEEARLYRDRTKKNLRFLHVSTDEVYGSLEEEDEPFTEDSPYKPSSPYAASKASSDHFVRSHGRTYGLDVIVTHCSNNFGPYQYPEKLIPASIKRALDGKDVILYGDGMNKRDWLFVGDHCDGIAKALSLGVSGRTYAFGGRNEITNTELVHKILVMLDDIAPKGGSYAAQMRFVKDRPGHDHRYAISPDRAERELGWSASTHFDERLEATVRHYVEAFSS